MNLLDHVLNIRMLIHRSFNGKMERIGIGVSQYEERTSLTDEDVALRSRIIDINNTHLQEKQGDYVAAREYTLKQCVFTLFNRLAAIKLMEQKQLFPEVIKQRVENGGLSAAHQMWLEGHPEGRSMERDGLLSFMEDKFKDMVNLNFLIYQSDYPYSMMPTSDELNEIVQAFNAIENDPDCADAWQKDDILGWLYENFNSAEKVEFKDSGEKTEYDKVSLQSQVYTPSWVVKFLVDNSLGKLYLEMFPDSELDKADMDGKRRYAIANRPATQVRQPKDLRSLKIIDPACGSGNFLLYSFSLLYEMYLEQIERYGRDYNKREIPALIVENNLYGVDLDERAVQLAQIGLLIKAREMGGRRGRMPEHTHVVCSNFYLPPFEEVKEQFDIDTSWNANLKEIARKIWSDLRDAPKFGSLVRVEEQLNAITPNDDNHDLFSMEEMTSLFDEKNKMKIQLTNLVHQYGSEKGNPYTLLKMGEAMTFLDVISSEFDVVVANPPYTDSGDFGIELKNFVEENYRRPLKFNSNLYACFIKRCCELAGDDGKVGMIHPHTFMFIKTFEDVRKFMLEKTHINVMVDYGLDRVNLFGPGILLDATFYTLDMNPKDNTPGVYFNITAGQQEKYKKGSLNQAFTDFCNGIDNVRVYTLPQAKLKGIKSYPFIYWISDEFRKKFAEYPLSREASVISGFKTGKNEGALRFWWEVSSEEWISYTKGGAYNKWYGNVWLKINSFDDFAYIRSQNSYNIPSVLFKEGITYNGSGSKGVTFRLLEDDTHYDMGACALFPDDVFLMLGVLNSKLIIYSTDCLNPTVNVQPGDIHRLPYFDTSAADRTSCDLIRKLTKVNINIKKSLCKYSLLEPLYEQSPILTVGDINTSIAFFYNMENAMLTQVLINEAVINRTIFDVYELREKDRQMVLEKEGIPVGDLPVSHEAKEAYHQWLMLESEFKPSNVVLEHLDALEVCNDLPHIPDFDTLYQNNKEWEEFCIQHKMNPVEVWWQFKNASVLPPQRTQTLAFELITDVIRALLDKDDDGVIPLTSNSGEASLAPRIEAEMVERGYSAAQIAQVFSLLGGGNLQRYLQERFFQQLSDHLNLFMYLPKTPFIWHITSGRHHALELYVSIYKWNRDILQRIKSVYAANREAALNDRLQVLLQGDATQKAEAAEVRQQLKELTEFCVKIDQLLASGYNPKLDDGVGKNIAPLQKAGIISFEVLKSTQLKKYLNADW